MKMKKYYSLSLLLFSCIFIFSSCSASQANEICESNRFAWSVSADENQQEGEGHTLSKGMSTNLNINNINGEYITYDKTLTYDGETMEFVFSYSYEAGFSSDLKMMVTLNGRLHPFYTKDDDEKYYFKTISLEESQNIRQTFIIKDINELSHEQPSYIAFHFFSNYEGIHFQADNPGARSDLVYGYYISPDSDFTPQTPVKNDDIINLSDIKKSQNVRESIHEENQYILSEIFPNKKNEEIKLENFEYNIQYSKGEGLKLLLAHDPGKFRTFIINGTQIIPCFDGKPYLDWETENASKVFEVPLSIPDDFIIDTSSSLYAVTCNLSLMSDYKQQKELPAEDVFVLGYPVTLLASE